jgi:hypothetical protein
LFTDNIIFYSSRGFLFLTVLAGLLKMALAFSRKRFRLYFAKGCLSISKNSNDEVEKMEFLIKGLNSYNSFLKRYQTWSKWNKKNLFNDYHSSHKREKTVNKIIQFFESGDTLEPVTYLSSLKDATTELFLVEEPLEQKIKLQVTYAAGIIPVILTVIQSVINFKG